MKIQLQEQKDSLVRILIMRNNELFINVSNNLDIDDSTKRQNYTLISTLNVQVTSHTVSKLLYEIIKLSKAFPDSSISKIKHPQGSASEVINIPE